MKTCPECHGEFQDTVNECPKDRIELKNINSLIGICLADRYQIVSMLGSGGTGTVYKAHHLKMEKAVAIKMMHSHMMARPDALKRFYEEAKTVARLKHHNIVTLYDFGITSSNQPFLAMDYIEGPSLKKYIELNGPISLEQMRPILAQIIDGLAYAHAEGTIHQDLKPENIMLTEVGQPPDKVSIVDFGLALLCSPDKEMANSGNKKKQAIGSPYYMSPEQCLSSSKVDARSDIYSLSIVLYEALTTKLPFEKKSAMAMMDSHVREIPCHFKNSNPDLLGLQVCSELTNVFNKAMAKDPADRYQSIIEFGAELDEALARDAVKVKAVKHRSLAAEQVLVHANNTVQSQDALNVRQREGSKLQLANGAQFLSQQAEIEEAYLNSTPSAITPIRVKTIQKVNNIFALLKGLGRTRDIERNEEVVRDVVVQTIECPNCNAPLKPGIQFCLNCQRTLVPRARPVKLSEARTGNSFTSYRIERVNLDEQSEAKNKLQNLRQQKIVCLIKVQRVLNYAVLVAVIIGGIIIIQRYFMMNASWQSLGQFISNNKIMEYQR